MDLPWDSAFTWLLPILLPLALAIVVLARRCQSAAATFAPMAALPALILGLSCERERTFDIPWLLLGSRFGLDDVSRVFLCFTALLWLLAAGFAAGYLAHSPRRNRFLFFFLLAMAGNFGLILAHDMATFYVGFALMSFASYGLVVFDRDDNAMRAGRVYIALAMVGELLLFSGLIIASWTTGTTIWHGLGDQLTGAPGGDTARLLMVLGFAIKAGALPLHVWLPLAHPAAPVPASAVLSGAMIKAGLLGWLRILPSELAAPLPGWGELFLLPGLAAAFYGAAVGLTQTNPKTVLAYSSISQMGLVTVAVGLAALNAGAASAKWTAVLVYAMHHAFAKGALFLGVGMVARRGGATGPGWVYGVGLLLPALSLSGLPLTSGAFAKALLKAQLASAGGVWPAALALLLPLAAVGTTLLMARFLWLAWPRPASGQGSPAPGMWLSWLMLLAATALGVLFWPWPGELQVASWILPPARIWPALWPVALGAALASAVVIAAANSRRLPAPQLPAGDILVAGRAVDAAWRRLKAPIRHLLARYRRGLTAAGVKITRVARRFDALLR